MHVANKVQEAVFDILIPSFERNDSWNIEAYDYGAGFE
jgi:hypothetical protein